MDTALLNKNNSAGRFLRLFHAVIGRSKNVNVVDVWKQAFSLPAELSGADLNHEVAALLTAATEELRAMQANLGDARIPESLITPYIERAKHAMAVTLLTAQWSNASQYLTAETLLAFQWFAYQLEEESDVATDADIQNLHECLDELENLLNSEILPPSVTAFIKNHATAMRLALRQVPISGVRPLRKAIRATAADAHLEKDELQAEAQAVRNNGALAKAVSLLQKTWKKGAEVCGDAEKYGKGARILTDVVDAVTVLLP